jgi:hypothetical protein
MYRKRSWYGDVPDLRSLRPLVKKLPFSWRDTMIRAFHCCKKSTTNFVISTMEGFGIGFTQRGNCESLSHECVTLLTSMVPNVHVINCCLRRKLDLSSNRLQCFCNFGFTVVYSHYHRSCCLTITLMVKIWFANNYWMVWDLGKIEWEVATWEVEGGVLKL